MSKKMYSIGKFAKLTNVTERTLRYYDQKGLLKPSVRHESGHRFYTEKNLLRLQHILALKYIDYSLEDIGKSLNQSGEDLLSSLEVQTDLLQKKKAQLDQVIQTIDHVKKIIEGQEGHLDRELILALIYSLKSEKDMKEWMSEHVSQSLIDRMFMDGQSLETRIESEKEMMSLFADMITFYNEGRPVDDPLVQKKAMTLINTLSHVFKPENHAELEKLSDAINDVQQWHSSPISKEVEAYLTEVIQSIDSQTYHAFREKTE